MEELTLEEEDCREWNGKYENGVCKIDPLELSWLDSLEKALKHGCRGVVDSMSATTVVSSTVPPFGTIAAGVDITISGIQRARQCEEIIDHAAESIQEEDPDRLQEWETEYVSACGDPRQFREYTRQKLPSKTKT